MLIDLEDLREDARFKAVGSSSTTSNFADADVDRYINVYYGKIIGILSSVNDKIDLYQTGDADSKNITAGSNEVAPDTDMTLIRRVDIKYPSSSDYKQAFYIPISKPLEVGLDKYTGDGRLEYTFWNGKLLIFVGVESASIEYVANGVKIYNLPSLTALSAIGHTPKLITYYRDYLSTGAAMEYCQANESFSKTDRYKNDLIKLEDKIRIAYAKFINQKGVSVIKEDYS